ncbi:MAG TPA: CHAT domain-containing protein, partial [Accumulibacter sp.]|nr:CHAT domain-containing protein [Accumulibacter sp.]
KRLNVQLDVARGLRSGKGVRERLSAEQALGYWSRLIVTDADKPDGDCPETAGEADRSTAPSAGNDQTTSSNQSPGQTPPDQSATGKRRLPTALKYVFLSQRARAEARYQQSQPGLIEAIVLKQCAQPRHDPQLAKLLFQLLVPVEFKVVARELQRLLLVLDSYTAGLPWELLQADEEPLAVRMPMVRQLITGRYRANVPTAGRNSACLIVSPSTQGLTQRFADVPDALPKLPGAVAEGEALRACLNAVDWTDIVYCREDSDFLAVFNHLYQQPYRLLVICGHGIFEMSAKDGRLYTGVVLSDGMLITAVEIGAMEVVPEIVFLNCCYQAGMNSLRSPTRLAYSLARELIDIGVRCVVVAGWAIDDDAAKTFSCTFFAHMAGGAKFADAIFAARQTTYEQHPGSNTWGAYQAYGDPGYRLRVDQKPNRSQGVSYVAVEELLDSLESRRLDCAQDTASRRAAFADDQNWVGNQLANCPDDWRKRPQVQQVLANLYKALGASGFAAARAAYLAALQGQEPLDEARVTCSVAEQLANLEAREGDALIRQGDFKSGLQLIDSAIDRLQALERLAAAADGSASVHGERQALLGSALKRKALALAREKKAWKMIMPVLAQAAEAYFKGSGSPSRPYNTLNALQLDWLAGNRLFAADSGTAIARQCGVEAKRLFNDNQDFWDAASAVDALLVEHLIAGGSDDGTLLVKYRELAKEVPHYLSNWDSLRRQFEQLADLLKIRRAAGDDLHVRMLENLARQLSASE